eukprot:Colp12_sorted_trinity150504_noHs@33870
MDDLELELPFADEDDVEVLRLKREECGRCLRPNTACVCSVIPKDPYPIKTNVLILQHPKERFRNIRTVPFVEATLGPKCRVVIGSRFRRGDNPELDKALDSPDTILMYPSKKAVPINSLPALPDGRVRTLVLLDGTWRQAQNMYYRNDRLHSMNQVLLNLEDLPSSEYLVRQQPSEEAVSTLEAIALAVGALDNDPNLYEVMVRPLRAMVQTQLSHGEVRHDKRAQRFNKKKSKSKKADKADIRDLSSKVETAP